MNEYREMSSREEDVDEIYLMDLLRDIGQGIKRFWWLVIGMALISALLASFFKSMSYEPQYVAFATMSVKEKRNTGYNATQSAKKMETVFPYILTSGVLEDVITEEMGMDEMPGTVSVSAEEGVNIFTVYAIADDPKVAYELLWAVIDNYPQVAEYVVGKTNLEVLAESGVPRNPGKKAAVRSAMKKGGFLGAILGLLPMGIYILTRRTVKSKKELKKMFNLRVLGDIPFIRVKKRKKGQVLSSLSLMNERIPQHYVESVNKLTARVTKEMEQKEYKSILITSSVSQEGKSTLAANFAISAAKSGKKVVLVDCDMRNPSIASVMNEKGSFPGIGAVLFGKTDLEKALKKIDIPGGSLKVLYGGKTEDQAGELLGTKNMQSLIAVLAESADLVVFDAAPSDILVDSSVLAKFVDAAMYVVRYDYVKMRQIKNGLQTLNMSGVDILGYIFNSDERGHNRGYGYGYRYGYGYYGGYGRYLESGREERRIERFRRTKKD